MGTNSKNVYFEKAKVRLLWLILFSIIGLLWILSMDTNNVMGKVEGIFLVLFLLSLLSLKSTPIVSVFINGILALLLNALILFLVVINLYEFEKIVTPTIYEVLFILFIIFIDYLMVSAFYFSLKWFREKPALERSFDILDEEEF